MPGNRLQGSDFRNVQQAFLENASLVNRVVLFLQFAERVRGDAVASVDRFVYFARTENVYIEEVNRYDQDMFGIRKQGDLAIHSRFPIQGADEQHNYSGDLIIWRNRLWRVAEVVSPFAVGSSMMTVFFHTIMRQTDSQEIGERFMLRNLRFGQAIARIA